MKRVIPAVERVKVQRARRHRYAQYLSARRPNSARATLAPSFNALADVWDSLRIALMEATAAMDFLAVEHPSEVQPGDLIFMPESEVIQPCGIGFVDDEGVVHYYELEREER